MVARSREPARTRARRVRRAEVRVPPAAKSSSRRARALAKRSASRASSARLALRRTGLPVRASTRGRLSPSVPVVASSRTSRRANVETRPAASSRRGARAALAIRPPGRRDARCDGRPCGDRGVPASPDAWLEPAPEYAPANEEEEIVAAGSSEATPGVEAYWVEAYWAPPPHSAGRGSEEDEDANANPGDGGGSEGRFARESENPRASLEEPPQGPPPAASCVVTTVAGDAPSYAPYAEYAGALAAAYAPYSFAAGAGAYSAYSFAAGAAAAFPAAFPFPYSDPYSAAAPPGSKLGAASASADAFAAAFSSRSIAGAPGIMNVGGGGAAVGAAVGTAGGARPGSNPPPNPARDAEEDGDTPYRVSCSANAADRGARSASAWGRRRARALGASAYVAAAAPPPPRADPRPCRAPRRHPGASRRRLGSCALTAGPRVELGAPPRASAGRTRSTPARIPARRVRTRRLGLGRRPRRRQRVAAVFGLSGSGSRGAGIMVQGVPVPVPVPVPVRSRSRRGRRRGREGRRGVRREKRRGRHARRRRPRARNPSSAASDGRGCWYAAYPAPVPRRRVPRRRGLGAVLRRLRRDASDARRDNPKCSMLLRILRLVRAAPRGCRC